MSATASVRGNGEEAMEAPRPASSSTPDKLRSLVERIVRLETERRERGEDIKDIYTEAKSAGYSPKALRQVVARQLESEKQRADRELVEREIELMRSALGEFANLPLGQAALRGAAQ